MKTPQVPALPGMTPLGVLKHHVTGAIERGEKQAVEELTAKHESAREAAAGRVASHGVAVDWAAVWAEAAAAAQSAAEGAHNCAACGFAWVTIKPARGGFVAWCKAQNRGLGRAAFGAVAYGGGWEIRYSRTHTLNTQSISVHEAACCAFAKVLKAHGVNAIVGSRLD